MGNFSYKLYRLFLSLHSFSVTLLTLGSRLFFILLQINNRPEKWSSPGDAKVTRAVQPWSKDYHPPVATMDTNKILRRTLTEETRTQKGDTKTCLLCGLSYFFRPIRCREHLGLRTVRNRCSSANHIQSTLNALRRS